MRESASLRRLPDLGTHREGPIPRNNLPVTRPYHYPIPLLLKGDFISNWLTVV
jgi:hypothetical protein